MKKEEEERKVVDNSELRKKIVRELHVIKNKKKNKINEK